MLTSVHVTEEADRSLVVETDSRGQNWRGTAQAYVPQGMAEKIVRIDVVMDTSVKIKRLPTEAEMRSILYDTQAAFMAALIEFGLEAT